jgi:hypothetical protein
MQRINEVNVPIVGTKYLVPCMENVDYADWLPGQWTPILFVKESHVDPELGAERHHFHYDTRFISGHKLLVENGVCMSAAKVIAMYKHETFDDLVSRNYITWRARTCYRTQQLFPQTRAFQVLVVDKIKPNYVGTRMENMICPHRGTCLKGHPIKEHGGHKGITCPAHGLSWDVQTGFLIE